MKELYTVNSDDYKEIEYKVNHDYFKEFEEKIIKLYEDSVVLDDLEKFENIENIKFVCKNFYIRTEKSKYKKEILKWFYNIVEYGFKYYSTPNEVINSMQKSLELDAFPIYIKFLSNKQLEIDSESDLKFYKFVDSEFGGIMY